MPSLFNYFNAQQDANVDWNFNYAQHAVPLVWDALYEANAAQGINAQQAEEMAKAKTKYEFMRGLGSSPQTLLSPDQAFLLKQIEGSLHRELEELDSALELISTQAEVVRETGTAIRSHISNLRKVASQLGTSPQTELQPNPLAFEQGPAEAGLVPVQAGPFAGAVAQQVVPGPWPVGQG